MTLLAHQGGWDELLLAVVPVLVFVLVFRLARGRRTEDDGPGPGGEERP